MADRRVRGQTPTTRERGSRAPRPESPELFDQTLQPIPRPSQRRGDRSQPVVLPVGDPLTRQAGGPRPAGQAPRSSQRGRPAQQSRTGQPRRAGPPPAQHQPAPHQPAPPPDSRGLRRRMTRGEMRRRRRRRRIIAFALLLALVALGVALSVTVLFKVEGFRLEGPEKGTEPDTGIYTEDAILAALNVPLGENIFQFSLAEKEQAMAAALPYLETIQVRRSLPGTVVVRVTPAVERYAIGCAGGWAVLSGRFKVLQVAPDAPEGLVQITGAEALDPVAGFPLAILEDTVDAAVGDAAVDAATAGTAGSAGSSSAPSSESGEGEEAEQPWLEAVTEVLNGLEACGLSGEVTSLELGGLTEISFVYQGRVRVLLGTANNLDYKLEWASRLLKNENGEGLLETDKGRLDISHLRSDGSIQPVFSPGALDG